MGNCLGQKNQVRNNDPVSNSNGIDSNSLELRKVFDKFDIDSDGYIDEDEFRTIMISMGTTNELEISHMFDTVDIDGDHQITFEEFKTIATANPMTLSIKKVFDEMDVDGDNELTPDEFRLAFSRLGLKASEREVGEIFIKFDSNRDGKLSFEGLLRFFLLLNQLPK